MGQSVWFFGGGGGTDLTALPSFFFAVLFQYSTKKKP